MSTPSVLLDIRYEPEAQQACDDACEWWPRAYDQIELIEWVIARDHAEGLAITESGLTRALTLPGAISIGAPTVTFVYVREGQYAAIKTAKFEEGKPIQ